MRSKNLTVLFFIVIVLLLLFNVESAKYRSRNKSRGSSNRRVTTTRKQPTTSYKAPDKPPTSSAGWGNWVVAKPHQQVQPQKVSNTQQSSQHKPSAPPDPNRSFLEHEKKQQSPSNSAPNSATRPVGFDSKNTETDASKKVGWNVDSAKPPTNPGNDRPIGWNVGNTHANPSPNPGSNNQQHVSFVNNQANKNTAGNLGNAPPPYQQYPSPNTGYNSHPNAPPPPYQQYPSNTGYNTHPNGPPPPYQQYPSSNQFHQNQGYNPGFGHNPGYNQHYPQQGYGGFGGSPMGGFGGGYNYGLGAFGKPKTNWGGTISNVLAGAFIWHLVSGLVSKPYKVYNYNNQPDVVPPKMELPPNLITTCPENITSLCSPNTFALCTTNHTIMCVASAAQVAPCGENTNVSCISSTVQSPAAPAPETPSKPPEAQNTTINVPCISNATIMGSLEGGAFTSISVPSDIIKASKNGEVSLCVTTIAIPQTEKEIKETEEALKTNQNPCPLGQQNSGSGVCVPVSTIANSTDVPPISSSSVPS